MKATILFFLILWILTFLAPYLLSAVASENAAGQPDPQHAAADQGGKTMSLSPPPPSTVPTEAALTAMLIAFVANLWVTVDRMKALAEFLNGIRKNYWDESDEQKRAAYRHDWKSAVVGYAIVLLVLIVACAALALQFNNWPFLGLALPECGAFAFLIFGCISDWRRLK